MIRSVYKLIIIGSGPAGLTAAIYASRANLQPLIIEGSQPGGQLMGTSIIENWPGEQHIMGPKLMLNMQNHAKTFGAEFLSESVTKVNFKTKPFTLLTNRNKELSADAIIIATGASPNKLGVPGEKEYWGKGITTCAVCDAAFYKNKKVVVIGGGDTAMEEASFLKKFTKNITIIQLLDKLTASYAMQQRVIQDPDVTILYNSTVSEFHGNNEKVTHITIKNQANNSEQKIEIDGAFLAIGLTPNTAIFKEQIELNKQGYIIVSHHTNTSIEGVFAAGDAEDAHYRQAVTAAGAGCMAALDAERYLTQIMV